MAKKEIIRMNLEMTPKVREKLEWISSKTDESLSQVVRRSLAIYYLLLEQKEDGGTIVIRAAKGGGEKELLLL